jgi:hypothetical protein
LVKDAAEGRENILPNETIPMDEEATLDLDAE